MINLHDAKKKAIILVVDDSTPSLELLRGVLKSRYRTKTAKTGKTGLKLAQSQPQPDLILLNLTLPDMDGYQVCEQLKLSQVSQNIPVMLMTSLPEIQSEKRGFELGAVDYITKPISPSLLMARIKTHLGHKTLNDFLQDKNHFLQHEIAKRTQAINAIQDVTIMALASLAESRDLETGNHILRTQHYVKLLAEHLQHHPRFSAYLTDYNIRMLFKSAPLHDIGKVGIPDRILLKPGFLTVEEFEIMKTHTTIGWNAIAQAENVLGCQLEFLTTAKEIALSHQEKWNGSGYPHGLIGDQIPISARLMALADVYDALISRRVYKEPMLHEEAVQIIKAGRATHFDPDMVDAFIDIQDDMRQIALKFEDKDEDIALKKRMLQRAAIAAA